MDTSQLTAEQLEVLSKKMAEILLYLNNLRNRMEQRRFPQDDEFYRLVRYANDKVYRLRVKLHYEFRTAFKRRRCLIPASGYYEWLKEGKAKLPYLYELDGGQPFAFAGLWEQWWGPDHKAETPLESCTIVTTEPNDLARQMHDRMPAILDPADYEVWLNPANQDTAELSKLLDPFPADRMTRGRSARSSTTPATKGRSALTRLRLPLLEVHFLAELLEARLDSQSFLDRLPAPSHRHRQVELAIAHMLHPRGMRLERGRPAVWCLHHDDNIESLSVPAGEAVDRLVELLLLCRLAEPLLE